MSKIIEAQVAFMKKENEKMCLEIEKKLFGMAWDKPEALKLLNEASKRREAIFRHDKSEFHDPVNW